MTVTVAFLLAVVTVLLGLDDSEFQNSIPAEVTWAVRGKDVELPCDIAPEGRDALSMVLWFKGASGIPLYSLDARNGSILHWAMGSDLGGRSYFILGKGSKPSRLRITNVLMEDQGIYRCRVDFMDSPTRNFKYNLTLVVMPSDPMVFDNQGREVTGVAGPYLQGYELFLSCHVVGGRPRPLVSWWQDTVLLDDKMDSVTASLSVNHYSRPNVTRDLFNSRLQCRVMVSPLVPALTKEVRIDVYLKPETIKVSTLGGVRSAGRPQQFQCETRGSVPPARITWFMDGEPAKHATITTEEDGNFTVGVLTYKPGADDDGRELACRAENPRFPGSIIETSMTISVHYPPVVSVHVDSDVDFQNLREGDQMTLVCKVRAHPQATHISWFHGERHLTTNQSTGVAIQGINLHLKNLSHLHGGEYSCAAQNTEGDARSTPVTIRVQYAPICAPSFAQRTLAALRHETVRVLCEIRADPTQVKFRWTFNSSSEVFPVPPTRVLTPNSSHPSSFVDFTPKSEQDFGTLACWASNNVGFQIKPCLTHLIPARIPEVPRDCQVHNHSTGGLEVQCVAGDDGGLQQHFLLEAVETTSFPDNRSSGRTYFPLPAIKVLGSEPTFLLQGLEPGRPYQLQVYAVNGKGQSDPPVVIPFVQVENPSEKLHSIGSSNDIHLENQSTSLLVILGSLIGVAILVVCALAFTTGLLACRRKVASKIQLDRKYENALQEAQEVLQRQEDAFIIKVPLAKVNNTSRKSIHELLPMNVDVNDLLNVHDVLPLERPVSHVIHRNHPTYPREQRNSTFRQSSGDSRRTSLGYETISTMEDAIVPVRISKELGRTRSSKHIAPLGTGPEKSSEKNEISEPTALSALKDSDISENSSDRPILVRTSFIEDAIRRSHPRVTLDPEGKVLRCILPSDNPDSEQ